MRLQHTTTLQLALEVAQDYISADEGDRLAMGPVITKPFHMVGVDPEDEELKPYPSSLEVAKMQEELASLKYSMDAIRRQVKEVQTKTPGPVEGARKGNFRPDWNHCLSTAESRGITGISRKKPSGG